ncbi:MAG: phosphocholine cytidylyltransferase family protein [Gemmatimonadota bacterium]
MKVVIIAAGMGSRLWVETEKRPKTLLPYGDGTILSTIIAAFRSIGLDEFVITVGFNADEIVEHVRRQNSYGCRISFVENRDWQRANGLSVLAAASELGDQPFLLSMSDHVVTPGALQLIRSHPSSANLLLVDRLVERVFDIDDATKVQLRDSAIVGIGKELPFYDALDCGVFRLTSRFMDAVRAEAAEGREGISDAVRRLSAARDMEAVFMLEEHTWNDLDTPGAYRHAVSALSSGG